MVCVKDFKNAASERIGVGSHELLKVIYDNMVCSSGKSLKSVTEITRLVFL